MAEIPNSKDGYIEALDFIINFLKEHEQNIDNSIDELATVVESMEDTEVLLGKVEKLEEKIDNLQKEIANSIGYLPNAPKEALQTLEKQEPHAQIAPEISPVIIQSEPSIILHCKEWGDFQVLATQAQMVTFSLKQNENVFQADALKGNKIITYNVALPNFSIILKTCLSKLLDINEKNIMEGSLDKPK